MVERRVVAYDILRIVLTLLVVLGHSGYLQQDFGIGGVEWQLPLHRHPAYDYMLLRIIRLFPSWIYSFHMPLFMVLSGMVAFIT
jgi:fucose 4-O-acetylase-like acetyltransferase